MSRIVTIAAPSWNIADSYGRVALETKHALEDGGWIVNTIGHQPPNKTFHMTFLNVLLGHPTMFEQYGILANSGIKVAISMWESTQTPDHWAEVLNDCAEVIVPCHWNVDVFKECGVTAPVRRIPLGVSEVFQYRERVAGDKFRCVAIADWDDRKGWSSAFFAFVKAFGQREDVELILKSRRVSKNFGNRNVTDILADYSDQEMQELYASCDCMLFPAAGEGFGLPPREFARTGGIPIVTRYGGLADEVNSWARSVDYEEVPAWRHHPEFKGLGKWGVADVDQVCEQLLKVHAMSVEERNREGKQYSENVSQLYTWKQFGQGVVEVLEGVIDGNRISA